MSRIARSPHALWRIGLGALAIGTLCWLLVPAGGPHPQTSDDARLHDDARPRGDAPSRPAPSPTVPLVPSAPSTASAPKPKNASETPQHALPHPRSQKRDTLLAERALFERVERAIDDERWEEASHLLDGYVPASENDRTWEDRVLGFRVILACHTQPSSRATAAAEEFIEDFSASPLRRRVRRACLPLREPRP